MGSAREDAVLARCEHAGRESRARSKRAMVAGSGQADSPGELPFPTADRAGMLVLQPRVDAHQVEVMRALRREEHKRWHFELPFLCASGTCHAERARGAGCPIALSVADMGVAHPAPDYRRVVSWSGCSRSASVKRHVANTADVVFGGPCPACHRVPSLHLDLHHANGLVLYRSSLGLQGRGCRLSRGRRFLVRQKKKKKS